MPARPPAEQLDPIPGASHFVQINRTIPTGVPHFSFVDLNEGDDSARRGRINAILRARRFVYIEEQYLTHFDQDDYNAVLLRPDVSTSTAPDTIAGALRHRLVGPDPLDFVAILIPRKLDEEPRFANGVIYELRKRFITFLTQGSRRRRRSATSCWSSTSATRRASSPTSTPRTWSSTTYGRASARATWATAA